MSEEKSFPPTEEYMEAEQANLDKFRYEYVSKLTPEEQAAFKQMETAVETLIATNRPFMVFAAPTANETMVWRYQKYTNEKAPLSEEEGKQVLMRAWQCMRAHAAFFAQLTGHNIVFCDNANKPYYAFTPKGEIDSGHLHE